MRITLRATAALLPPALLVSGGAWSAPAAAATTGSLTVTTSGAVGATVAGAGAFTVGGDTPVGIAVASVSGGKATVVAGPDSTLPRAVQLPAYVATGTYPRAVLSLTPRSGLGLSPGTAGFSFGAVVRLDANSSGRTADNGDNIVQRGLSSEADMFKLELDHGRPACTVRGSTGTVIARSTTTVTRNAWYTVTCARVGGKVTVSATPYLATYGAATTAPASVTGNIGNVTFAATRPASVGGKLTAAGAVLGSASDQFNGAIADVWTTRS